MPSFVFMTKLELSPRLGAVAALVPAGARLADIGTDHGYLPVSLILNGIIHAAVAADIRPGPLDHARRTAAEYQLTERLDFRLCDGLAGISANECDTITIAGMGGETIVGILSAAPWTRQDHCLILQPQSTQDVLRTYLAENGYCICSEHVVREGDRWYPVLVVKGGHMEPLSPGEAVAGRADTWTQQDERLGYLQWLLHRTQQQLIGARQSDRPDQMEKVFRLQKIEAYLNAQIDLL